MIGTHALLSRNRWRSGGSGLVIVDEEQRFGVTHKEKLKTAARRCAYADPDRDADPAHLADGDVGPARIVDHPRRRRSTGWRCAPMSCRMGRRWWLREALLREHHRGGQSFIVVPRIADMAELEDWLHPRTGARGQVTSPRTARWRRTEVEERMSGLLRHGATTCCCRPPSSRADWIFPSANTIIIHRADRFGLAQLYQLRGRVGRAKTARLRISGDATPAGRVTGDTVAEKRLKVLGDLDSAWAPGSSWPATTSTFAAPAICWVTSSRGHIREVGFELYQSMLEDAILAAKAGEHREPSNARKAPARRSRWMRRS